MGLFSFLFGTKSNNYDAKFKKDIDKYDRGSYRKDLRSRDRDEKIRSIWGLEGMGNSGSIDELDRIAHDSKEDKWIRKEAKIASKNLKERCGK